MRYWWVNQNQTWRHEVAGGYLWSPKRKANGSDRGFISFRNDGRLLVSPVAHHSSLERMGVPVATELQTPPFTPEQREYLEFHRDAVFLQATTRAG